MEKRNRFFSFFKGKKKSTSQTPNNLTVLGFGGNANSLDDYAKQANSTYDSAVNCLAKHLSKIHPVAYYKDNAKTNADGFNRLLGLRPNPMQTASEFYYCLADQYYRNGIAMAHLIYDQNMNLSGLVPMDVSTMKVSRTKSGDVVYIRLVEGDGTVTEDIMENFLIVIRKPNASNPFLARENSISKVITALNANTDSFARAVTESHLIRYIAKMSTMTDDKKKAALRSDFTEQLESDASGLLIIPGVLDFQQVNTSSGVFAKQPELDDFIKEVYAYFGITQTFVMGDFTENQFQAVYENTLEPFINDLRQEMTYKLFTLTEIAHGNEIRIETSPLQTASLSTRISLANAIMSCGMYRPNDIMRLLYQEEIEGGDKIVQSLNYVDADKASQYQTGQPDDKPEDDDKDDKKKDDTEPDGDVTSNTQEGDQEHD